MRDGGCAARLLAVAALLALAAAPAAQKKGNCDRSCRRKPDCKQFPRRCSGCDMCKTEAEKARDAAIAAAMERRLVPPKRNRKKEGAERLIAAVNANDAQLLRELFLELPVGAVNWGTDGGMRPLFAALQVHKVEMVEVLLGYGADTRYEIEPGYTALAAAVLWGCKECTQALIRRRQPDAADAHRVAAEGEDGTGLFEGAVLEARDEDLRGAQGDRLALVVGDPAPQEARGARREGASARVPVAGVRPRRGGQRGAARAPALEQAVVPQQGEPGLARAVDVAGNLDSASVAREGTGRLKEAVGKKWPENLRMSCRGRYRPYVSESRDIQAVFGSPHTFGLVGLS